MTRSGWPPAGRVPRPYGVTELARALGLVPGDTAGLALVLGIGRRWVRRYRIVGLTEGQADDWACRAGIHPADVWARWYDELHGAALLNANRSTCPLGHPYDRRDSRGYRICSTCRSETKRRLRANMQVAALAPTELDGVRLSAPHLQLIMATVTDRDVLRPDEAADYLRLSIRQLQDMRYRKVGPAYTYVGQQVRYLRADLDAYLTAQRVDPRATAS